MKMSWCWLAVEDLPFAHWVGQDSDWTLRLMLSLARSDFIRVATMDSFVSPWV